MKFDEEFKKRRTEENQAKRHEGRKEVKEGRDFTLDFHAMKLPES